MKSWEKQREETGEEGKQSLIGNFTYPVPPVARIVTICLAVIVVHLQFGGFEARVAGRRADRLIFDMLVFQRLGVPTPASALTYAKMKTAQNYRAKVSVATFHTL